MIENVAPKQVWDALRSDPQARLVDVRTDAEWSYVGLPDLQETGHDPVLIPWQMFPGMQVNGRFADHRQVARRRLGHQVAMAGERRRRQVLEADVAVGGAARADQVAGWKADGLPWRQR